MEVYNIPVNAILPDVMDFQPEDFQDLVKLLHTFLELEYMLRVTGAIPSAVKGRGAAGRFEDFLG